MGFGIVLLGILMTSAVAMFFSWSDATDLSDLLAQLLNSVSGSGSETSERGFPVWTFQPRFRYDDSSSFFGLVLSILTLLPGFRVRKTL